MQFLRHYRLCHGQYSTVSPLPCLYKNCMCTFTTFNSLKVHLSKVHTEKIVLQADSHNATINKPFNYPVGDFKQPFIEKDMYSHLRGHLRLKEMVPCPFSACKFKTNVYSTYNAHKCREHKNASNYDEAVVVSNISTECQDSGIDYEPADFSDENETVAKAVSSTDGLEQQLQYNLAAFFLKMRTTLHVSQRATQEIIEHIDQLISCLHCHSLWSESLWSRY